MPEAKKPAHGGKTRAAVPAPAYLVGELDLADGALLSDLREKLRPFALTLTQLSRVVQRPRRVVEKFLAHPDVTLSPVDDALPLRWRWAEVQDFLQAHGWKGKANENLPRLARTRAGRPRRDIKPSRYAPLSELLQKTPTSTGTVSFSFAEIEDLVGELPRTARTSRAWWTAMPSRVQPQQKAWSSVGWSCTRVALEEESVVFERSRT